MRDFFIRIGIVAGLLIIVVAQFAFAAENPNEVLAWGFRRSKNHVQPVLDAKSFSVLKDFNGIAIGNEESKSVYLTFDCGYEGGYTDSIIKTLKANNVKATFFITAYYLNSAEEKVFEMVKNGNAIGNHTVNHKCMPQLSDEQIKDELMKLHIAVLEKTGYEMKYFRPPKGEFNSRVLKVAKDLNYKTVLWSNAYDDWDVNKQGREEYGKQKVLDNMHNGCVLLLHSTSKDNMNILDDLIKEIKKMGYEFKTLDEFE